MSDYEKQTMLLSIARMYYENNYSQKEIAQKLDISRPYVSKLIQEAHSSGIIKIIINDPMISETSMERRIRLKYRLLRTFVVPNNPGEYSLTQIGITAAKYLNSIVKSGDIIGVNNGTTINHCALNLIHRDDLEDVKVVQLTGEYINVSHRISTADNVRLFADALNGVPYAMPLPLFFQNSKTKKSILSDKNIQKVCNLQEAANIVIFSVGGFGTVGTNTLIRSSFVSQEEMDDLMENGAAGDIISHFINKKGEICNPLLDERTVSLPLHLLKQKEYRICVAGGRGKLNSLYAALQGGFMNVLIVDEDLAKDILSKDL